MIFSELNLLKEAAQDEQLTIVILAILYDFAIQLKFSSQIVPMLSIV